MSNEDARLQAATGIQAGPSAAGADNPLAGEQVVPQPIPASRSPAGMARDQSGGLIDLGLFFAILSILAGAYGFTGMAGSGAPAFVFSIALVGVIVALVLRRLLSR